MEPEWATATEEERHKMVEAHTPKAIRNSWVVACTAAGDEPIQSIQSLSVILVRHGQYHTEAKEREERKLTPLGW
jgi:hypothetical protein